tara:strand:- start:607 stop:1656 length:1050 start_codon:yes stop_codon:yes gene_type:complete
MAISDKTNFWQLRTDGYDPATVSHNELTAWSKSGSGGSASGGNWVVTDQTMTHTPAAGKVAYSMWALIQYNTAPDTDEILMKLDNGTKTVSVKANGATGLKLVGATTTTFTDLDLINEPTILRLTMDSSGEAKLYLFEIIEDDDAATSYITVAGASGSSRSIQWGNTTGSVKWLALYATTDGAYSPDEMSPSPFVNDTIIRTGLKVVELLQNCDRPYIKGFVDTSSIRYGYDISSSMISRIAAPSIHVVMKNVESSELDTLGGHRALTRSQIQVFILTRGTNYKNAYRLCLDIAADVFDEIMINLGLDFNTDAITSYSLSLDTKMDEDETVCVHQLNFDTMRRIHLQRR